MACYNPLLLCDFYKCCHSDQYPVGLTKMVSYYTPRMTRLFDTDRVTFFGLQAFIKEYLIKTFDEEFFMQDEEDVVNEYERVLNATLGHGTYNSQKIRDLWHLGYLPLEIKAVPEGMRTAIGVPQIEISNTHPNFVWLVNTIETMLSCSMWHTQVSAEVGYRYWDIVRPWWKITCDESINPRRLLGDFSMRGQHSVESAIKSSGAWCLSFLNTATVPAIMWLENNYNCDCTKELVAYGAISTEHSVMCSNQAVDGDEVTQVRRLLTEIYPHHSFSMVSDSYDYWNLITKILPQLKKEIMEHDGCLSVRGDSGDPVEIIAGVPFMKIETEEVDLFKEALEDFCLLNEWLDGFVDPEYSGHVIILCDGIYYRVEVESIEERDYDGSWFYSDAKKLEENIVPTPEEKGTVWTLWDIFGGTINSKGYKVLDPHIKAIYGDSITPKRCEKIYIELANKGFSISNVTLGVGSFSMMCLNGKQPYTRDTFGIAVKATYAEDKDGVGIAIYKQPKALSWKKSQKGCCIVEMDGQSYTDGHTFDDVRHWPRNLLSTVFKDGKMVKEYSLAEVRSNMYPEGF